MAPGDLTSAETSEALRRIAEVVGCGARRCAWALTTFGDEHRATVALVTPAHLDRARTSLTITEAGPNSALYSPRWRAAMARYERLLAEKDPAAPAPPEELSAYVLRLVGLAPDPHPRVPVVRKVGIRPAHVLIALHRGGGSPESIADAAALAADVFPIGSGWRRTPYDVAVREAGDAIARDLAYGTRFHTKEVAEARIRRFLGVFSRDAIYFMNGERDGNCRMSSPLTLSTFDNGMAVVDHQRVGIIVRTGED